MSKLFGNISTRPLVLAVDDSVENLQVLSAILKDDYQVKVAKSGQKALEIAQNSPHPDLILLDVMMPDMNGFEVCEQLKNHPITQKIPVIFLTALNEVADETMGFKSGGADFISKPINPDIVKARIKTHIALQQERSRTEELLKVLLPENVISDLMEEGVHKPQIQENVSIMFCDLVGFTQISSKLDPEFLIAELNDIYGYFDELCSKYKCSRIKTIGDAYMAATGIHQFDPLHADKLVKLGLEFIRFLEQRNSQAQQEWKCRIGIHSGSVIAGIIGKTRFIYDIFGHDVNIAARVESNGMEMHVTISTTTKDLLREKYDFISMGNVQLKGAEAMDLFAISTSLTRLEKVRRFAEDQLSNHLPEGLFYHNLEHTIDVFHAADEIAFYENLGRDEREILLTAVWFHDLGFLKVMKGHEEISCQLAAQYLPQFHYSQAEIEVVLGLIRATQIPQTPHNKLEEIIADADLDYLGRADFPSIGKRLFDELKVQKVVTTERQWNELQVEFLTSHRYFTATSVEKRMPKKLEHLKQLKQNLSQS